MTRLVFDSFSFSFLWFLFCLRYFVVAVNVAYVDEHFAVNIVEAVTAVVLFSIFSVVRRWSIGILRDKCTVSDRISLQNFRTCRFHY